MIDTATTGQIGLRVRGEMGRSFRSWAKEFKLVLDILVFPLPSQRDWSRGGDGLLVFDGAPTDH